MKILQLIDERWDSGLTEYAIQIAELLHKNGHQVTVGVRAGKKPETIAKARGLTTAACDTFPQFRSLFSQKWDVVNAHTGSTHSKSLLLNHFRLIGTRTPLIRTRGDARPVTATPLSRFLYNRTDAVIAASDHIAKYYEEGFGLGEDKLAVVYPSVEVEPWQEPPADRVGILGRLDPVKGHAIFLEAAAQVLKERPQAKFVIAGKEANVSWDLLQNQVRELGIEKSVEYVGFQPSAQQFMKSCSIGVIASVGSEEISRACLEWMACGRPVVATLVGCLPELVEPGETGLIVAPDDGAALGRDILKLLTEPELASSWGQNARRRIERKFSPSVQLSQTLDIYNRAIAARKN